MIFEGKCSPREDSPSVYAVLIDVTSTSRNQTPRQKFQLSQSNAGSVGYVKVEGDLDTRWFVSTNRNITESWLRWSHARFVWWRRMMGFIGCSSLACIPPRSLMYHLLVFPCWTWKKYRGRRVTSLSTIASLLNWEPPSRVSVACTSSDPVEVSLKTLSGQDVNSDSSKYRVRCMQWSSCNELYYHTIILLITLCPWTGCVNSGHGSIYPHNDHVIV